MSISIFFKYKYIDYYIALCLTIVIYLYISTPYKTFVEKLYKKSQIFVNYKIYRVLCSIYKIASISTLVDKRAKLEYRLIYFIISIISKNKNIINIKASKYNSKNNLIVFNFEIF